MLKRRFWQWSLAFIGCTGLATAFLWRDVQGQKLSEIRFDLGNNIIDTAKGSGVPKFSARDIQGLISYSINDIPEGIPARYTRTGYEVTWEPVFAVTMYADRAVNPKIPVNHVALQMKKQADMNDVRAKAFVESTIEQFRKGKWQRYATPEWEVLLTGRSSILDESGQLSDDLWTIDPAYKLTLDEWRLAARKGMYFRWLGDGVYAQLSVRNSPLANGRDDYDMDLEFELQDVRLKHLADTESQKLKDGDLKGWNSTAEHEANKRKAIERNKRLKESAVQRGDSFLELPTP